MQHTTPAAEGAISALAKQVSLVLERGPGGPGLS